MRNPEQRAVSRQRPLAGQWVGAARTPGSRPWAIGKARVWPFGAGCLGPDLGAAASRPGARAKASSPVHLSYVTRQVGDGPTGLDEA